MAVDCSCGQRLHVEKTMRWTYRFEGWEKRIRAPILFDVIKERASKRGQLHLNEIQTTRRSDPAM